MRSLVVRFITRVSLLVGAWFIGSIAWWVSTGYFLFRTSRRRASVGLYRAVYPERSFLYHHYCSWGQFHSFASTYSDRIRLHGGAGLAISTAGKENLLSLARKGTGGVIVMSHMGSYEVAATGFQEYGLRLLILLGEREAKQVARNQREALAAKGIHIHVAGTDVDSRYGGLEALRFIREGGFVSVAGDLVWTDQRTQARVRFFGRDIGFTTAPYLLAMVSGAPLVTMFTYRTGKGAHQVEISAPREVKVRSRSERTGAIRASAQAYAAELEGMVRKHPFQWYVFDPIFQPISEGAVES